MIIAKEKYKDTYIVYIDESKEKDSEGSQLAYTDLDTASLLSEMIEQIDSCPSYSNIMNLLFRRGVSQPLGDRRLALL